MLKFGIKIPYLGNLTQNPLFEYFWTRSLKNYCHIWNQHPQICLTAKFCEKKCLNLGQKNVLFAYFWAKILKNYRHI